MRAPVASCRRNVIKVTAVLGAQQLAASSKLIWEPVGRTVDPDYFPSILNADPDRGGTFFKIKT